MLEVAAGDQVSTGIRDQVCENADFHVLANQFDHSCNSCRSKNFGEYLYMSDNKTE